MMRIMIILVVMSELISPVVASTDRMQYNSDIIGIIFGYLGPTEWQKSLRVYSHWYHALQPRMISTLYHQYTHFRIPATAADITTLLEYPPVFTAHLDQSQLSPKRRLSVGQTILPIPWVLSVTDATGTALRVEVTSKWKLVRHGEVFDGVSYWLVYQSTTLVEDSETHIGLEFQRGVLTRVEIYFLGSPILHFTRSAEKHEQRQYEPWYAQLALWTRFGSTRLATFDAATAIHVLFRIQHLPL